MSTKIRNISVDKKIKTVIILIILLIFVTIGIPSFCKLLMESDITTTIYWDGTVALSYDGGNGEENNPYIISTPQQLALLAKEVNEGNNYENTYFEIVNDLYLNKGVIEYVDDKIIYINNSIKYYIKPYTMDYYKEETYKNKVDSIFEFPTLKTFKGTIKSNNKTIYGLYLTSEENKELSLFNNLEGNINNLSISNSLIYGTNKTGLITNAKNSNINDLFFYGTIKNNPTIETSTINIEDILLNELEITVPIDLTSIPNYSNIESVTLNGTYPGTGLTINNIEIEEENFSITGTELFKELVITLDELPEDISLEEPETTQPNLYLSNLVYEIKYYDDISSLINISNNTNITNTVIKGNIIGNNITSGIVGVSTNDLTITNTYNKSKVIGNNISSGLISLADNSKITLNNTYNANDIVSNNYTGGLIGSINNTSEVNINNSFNIGNIEGLTTGSIIGNNEEAMITTANTHYTNFDIKSVGNSEDEIAFNTEQTELLELNYLKDNLNYTTDNWNLLDGELPSLINLDEEETEVILSFNDYTWTIQSLTNQEIRLEETGNLDIKYTDDSDILKIEYFISNEQSTEVLDPNDIDYIPYKDKINLNKSGYYTIYFKVTDVFGNIAYVNTDLLVLDGYNLKITDVYNNDLTTYNNQITNKSTIKYKYEREINLDTFNYNNNSKYYLVSNIQLPNNTIISLIDNINNKIYNYTTKEEDVILDNGTYQYDLSLLKEIGTTNINYFNNLTKNYYNNNILKEDFEIILDFKNTTIENNLNIELDLYSKYDNYIYSKVFTNIEKNFTIAVLDDNKEQTNNTINLSTSFNSYINLSEVKETKLNLESNIIEKKLNNKNIFDSNISKDKITLNITLVDEDKNIIKGSNINALSFVLDEVKYYANDDGITRIPLTKVSNNLILSVEHIANELINGIYYLNLNTCSHNNSCSNIIVIPCNLDNEKTSTEYKFNVTSDINDRLILRSRGETLNKDTTLNLNIDYQGSFKAPNIRVKLYQKLDFKADNQIYELIDLNNYIYDNLKQVENKEYEYYLIEKIEGNTIIDLSLNISNFGYSGYKLIFELYDGDTYIGKDSKTILVK